jgi:hypothetical protein
MTTGQIPAATPAAPDDLDPALEVERAFLAIAVELIAEGWPGSEPRARPDMRRTPPRPHRAVGFLGAARPGPGRRKAGPGGRVGRVRGARPPLPRERSPPVAPTP